MGCSSSCSSVSSLSSFSPIISTAGLPVNSIRDIDLRGGQCSWCGKYGHRRPACPFL
ncbi:hypothetical protein BDC45DRAFT_503602, partial [Circinella umbellata]